MEKEATRVKRKGPRRQAPALLEMQQGCLAEAPEGSTANGPNPRWEIPELRDGTSAGLVWSPALYRIRRRFSLTKLLCAADADWSPTWWTAGPNGGCFWISRWAECRKQRKLM